MRGGGSCTPDATEQGARSWSRWSGRCGKRRASRSSNRVEARRLVLRDGRIVAVLAGLGDDERGCLSELAGSCWRRAASAACSRNHQSSRSFGHGLALAAEAGRSWPTPSSSSSIRPRSTAAPPAAAGQRGGARRGRDPRSTRRGERFMPGRPAPSSRRATWSRARSGGTSRPGIACSSTRGSAAAPASRSAFPASGALPRGRHRSAHGADPGAAGGALPHGRHRGGCAGRSTSRRASGPAARSRRPACTAPTAWPATRCLKGRVRRAASAASVAGTRPRRSRPAVRAPPVPQHRRDGDPPGVTRGAGLERAAAGSRAPWPRSRRRRFGPAIATGPAALGR